MKRKAILLLLIVFTIASLTRISGQKGDLTGTWKLDRTKSTILQDSPTLIKINVQVMGDSLLTERTYDTGDGQEYPFNENFTLDGKEYEITIYEMPRTSKAIWSGTEGVLKLESKTTFSGPNGAEDFVSKETWKVDKANNLLTITFKNSTSAGESEGTFLFNKAE